MGVSLGRWRNSSARRLASLGNRAALEGKNPAVIRGMLHWTALLAGYVLVAWMGLTVAFVHGTVSPVWLGTGLAIAALTLWGPRLWLAITLGSFAANFLFADNSAPVAAGIAVGNTLEAVLGALVLRRLGVRGEVARVRDAMAILAVAGLAPLPSATNGVLWLTLAGFSTWDNYPWTWLVWWVGNFMGALISLPFLLAWAGEPSVVKYPARPLEFAGVVGLAAILISFAYLNTNALAALDVPSLPPSAFLFPPMVWGVHRLRPRENTLVMALASGLAAIFTVAGTQGETIGPLLWLQMVLLAVVGGSLLLVGALAERTQAVQALRESEGRLALALEASDSAVWETDLAQGIVRGDDRLFTGLGYSPGELAASADWQALIHKDDQAAAAEKYDEVIQGKRERSRVDIRVRAKDGSWRWRVVHAMAAERNEEGRALRLIGTYTDITDRKAAEEQIQSLNAELENRVRERTAQLQESNAALLKSNAELKHFAHATAHDLQTPLRSIAGFSQLVQKEVQGRGNEQVNEWSAAVVDNTRRLQMLIQELLAYTRLEAQGLPFEMTDLGQLFDEVVASLSVLIGETRAEVTCRALPALPVDRTQIAQVFQNLIENGIKYNRSELPRIVVSAELQDGQWMFSVADNGLGIDPKHHNRIFELFQRLHAYHQVPGTGIGLALCRRIVERHGGHIWVDSRPGEGSTFYFSLPVRNTRRHEPDETPLIR